MAMLAWLLAVGALLAAIALATVRVVPAHERAVVLRFGRVDRLRGPGVIVVVPGLERLARVSVRDVALEPLVTRATTRDDVSVWVTATAHFRVVDPICSTMAVPDVYARTAEAIEVAVRDDVDRCALHELAHRSSERTQRLLRAVNMVVHEWGVEVGALEISTIELRLTPELLHWAERLHHRRRCET